MHTVVIHQPDFAPYLGFFHRFLHADLYIALDHVQFVSKGRGWTHRDKIKTINGEKWISLSVKKMPLDTPIDQIQLAQESEWIQKNIALLHENYRKSPAFKEIMPIIVELYQSPPLLMCDFNLRWLERLMDLLDIRIPLILSSSLSPQGHKNDLLVDILTKVGATHYLSGNGARDYMDVEKFKTAGIDVVWQEFNHPIYPQQFGTFIPFLSIIDVLFNCGVNGTKSLLGECK